MGLFGRSRRKASSSDEAVRILGVLLKVRAGEIALPVPFVGAYVTAFTVAADHTQAAKQAALAIFAMGYDVEEILPEGLELPMSLWGAHIAEAWPDFVDHYPTQAEIATKLADGRVVFSPFAAFWPKEAAPQNANEGL